MMTRAHRQQALSRAYVRAIAAKAGVICTAPEDDYGIDMCLREVRLEGMHYRDIGTQIDLQLKSTTLARVTAKGVLYDLDVRNYEALRQEGINCPRFLVVLVLPEDEADWLEQSMEELQLRHCAYWMSLKGASPTNSKSTVRLKLPLGNVFSVEFVRQVLANLSGSNES